MVFTTRGLLLASGGWPLPGVQIPECTRRPLPGNQELSSQNASNAEMENPCFMLSHQHWEASTTEILSSWTAVHWRAGIHQITHHCVLNLRNRRHAQRARRGGKKPLWGGLSEACRLQSVGQAEWQVTAGAKAPGQGRVVL